MKIQFSINHFLEKIDDNQRYYIFAGLLLFVFLLDYFILMRPQLNALSKITPEIKILSDDLQVSRENILHKNRYQTQIQKLQEQVDDMESRIKEREQLPLVFEWISRAAYQAGLKIDQMVPVSEEQEKLFIDKNTTYVAMPLKIQARGGYHQFGKFLNLLELGDMFLRVGEFSIVSSDGQSPHDIQMTLMVMIHEN